MNKQRVWLGVVAAAILTGWPVTRSASAGSGLVPLIIHEWGTFTSLQNESGEAISSINVDDEPLPNFVHNLWEKLLARPQETLPSLAHLPVGLRSPAAAPYPRVTMRLETPVIYFYPAGASTDPFDVDVNVRFRGGWLTQFYPDAAVEAPGASDGVLSEETVGRLVWKKVRVGGAAPGPETTERVWTAPREVSAASVATPDGETERYLFYRGVGQLDAPLRVVRNAATDQLELYSQLEASWPQNRSLVIPRLWLAQIRPDGACAFRTLGRVTLSSEISERAAAVAASFREEEFAQSHLSALQTSMREGLIQDGLYPDEAQAMLNTWEVSYFKNPGLRLFFLVPQAWTETRLPLEVSVPALIRRVMVGRIELVSPEQRALLRQIAEGPAPAQPFGPEMPSAYKDLGRFRDALLLDEAEHRPTPALRSFIALNGLGGALHVKGLSPERESRHGIEHGNVVVE